MADKTDHAYVRGLSRGRIVLFLEQELGIACYDHESHRELVDALVANIGDETTTRYDVEQYMELIDITLNKINQKLTDFERTVMEQKGL